MRKISKFELRRGGSGRNLRDIMPFRRKEIAKIPKTHNLDVLVPYGDNTFTSLNKMKKFWRKKERNQSKKVKERKKQKTYTYSKAIIIEPFQNRRIKRNCIELQQMHFNQGFLYLWEKKSLFPILYCYLKTNHNKMWTNEYLKGFLSYCHFKRIVLHCSRSVYTPILLLFS